MPAVYKVLGQVSPTNTSEATLYVVPSATEAVGSTLIIANISASAATATLRVRPAGIAAANKHIVLPEVTIFPNRALTLTIGLTLEATDLVTLQSSAGNALSASLFGTEI
jgi:hypothetical protein